MEKALQAQIVQQEIKRTDTIDEIFERFPGKAQKLAQIMTNLGLSCIGCHASTYETLEQGTLGHGMTEKELDTVIKELDKTLNEKIKIKSVSVSSDAAKKIKDLLKKEKKSGWGLKVGVFPGGCSGYQYTLGFQEKAGKDEETITSKGISLFHSKQDSEKLNGSEVDYIDGLQGAGFKVNNPNVTKSCRCGSSVGF